MSDRIRVRDTDTGHERTIAAHRLTRGNYEVLDEPAVDPRTGDDLPPVCAAHKPADTKPAESPASRGGKKESGHKATNEIEES